MRDKYKVLFIIFVSLGVYYPSIFGSVNSTDDHLMITNLMNIQQIDWKGLFLPESSVYYYRPLLIVSFLFDMRVFDCHEFFMHLENVLLHTANGVLVFYIVREIQKIFKVLDGLYIPMFSSLLFIAHPINSEAVNWISGRTDVLAGVFVFASFLFFLKKGMKSYQWCCISAVFYLMGLLSKETAIGLLPVVGIFLLLMERHVGNMRMKDMAISFSPFVIVTAIYLLMRIPPAGGVDLGVSTAVNIPEGSNILISISGAIKAFGFYIKKLFIPLPLNFGIIEINRIFYFWLGIIVLGLIFYLFLKKRRLLLFLLFFSIIFFLPAIPVAISKMAWAPLAERYLYISSFGVSVIVVLLVSHKPWKEEFVHGFLAVLLAICAVVTVNRNIIWQSNLTLYEDTIKKSPNFAPAWNEYGIALANMGRIEEAAEQFKIAKKLVGDNKYKELPSLNIIRLSKINKKPEEIQKKYLNILNEKLSPGATKKVLQNLIENSEAMAGKEKKSIRVAALYREIISYFEQLYELEGNGFYLYKIGQYHLALGEKDRAVESFKKAVEISPNEYYSEPARKLAKKLENEIKN